MLNIIDNVVINIADQPYLNDEIHKNINKPPSLKRYLVWHSTYFLHYLI